MTKDRWVIHAQILCISAAIWTVACLAQTSFAQPRAGNEEPYGPLPQQKITVCGTLRPGASNPGVLLLHGGGWTGGTAAGFKGKCEFFAQHGFVAATLEYRLAGDAARWPAQREDAELAVRWLRAHADEIGLDGNHICAYGESAGAHIALGLGAPEYKVACIVDAFGPTDLAALIGRPGYLRAFHALFGDDEPNWRQRLRDASPVFNLGPGFPPVLIVQGESDDLVPPEQSTSLFAELIRLKSPVIAIMYRGGHSWLGLDAPASAALMDHIIMFMKSPPQR